MQSSESAKQYKTNNNYYAVLDIENDVDNDILNKFENYINEKVNTTTVSNHTDKTINSGVNARIPPRETQLNNNSTDRKQKIPPINIIDIDTKCLIECVKKGLKIDDFQIKEFRSKKALYVNKIEDFHRIKTYLQKAKAKFYTFTPKAQKTQTYLLKGLDSEVTLDEIFEELTKQETDTLQFVKVSKFATKRSTEQGISLPIFMVQVSPNSNINEVKNIKRLLHRCIYWERLRRPEIPQCRNCQGYFHSAANCFLPTKCVKCNLQHEKGNCQQISNEDDKSKLYCVVCKKYGHPASYKGCEVYKQLQNRLTSKKKQIVEAKQKTFNHFVNPETSFASIVKNNQKINHDYDKSNRDFFIELKNMMTSLSNQIFNLEKKVNAQEARIDAIFSMVGV